MTEKQIREIYNQLYYPISGEIPVLDLSSTVEFSDDVRPQFEKTEINLGKIESTIFGIELKILNGSSKPLRISRADLQPGVVSNLPSIANFEKTFPLLIKPYTTNPFLVYLDFKETQSGFTSFYLWLYDDDGNSFNILIKGVIAKQLNQRDPDKSDEAIFHFHTRDFIKVTDANNPDSVIKIDVPKNYIKIVSYSFDDDCLWIEVINLDRSANLFLMADGEKRYVGSTNTINNVDDLITFRDNLSRPINNYYNNTFYLSSELRVYQKISNPKPDFIIFVSGLTGKKKLKVKKHPEWITFSETIHNREICFNGWLNRNIPIKSNLSEMIVLSYGKNVFNIAVELIDSRHSIKVSDISIVPFQNNNSQEDNDKISTTEFSCSFKIAGWGELTVFIPIPQVHHQGTIINDSEIFDIIKEYMIKIENDWLWKNNSKDLSIPFILTDNYGNINYLIGVIRRPENKNIVIRQALVGPIPLFPALPIKYKLPTEHRDDEIILSFDHSFSGDLSATADLNINLFNNGSFYLCGNITEKTRDSIAIRLDLEVSTNCRVYNYHWTIQFVPFISRLQAEIIEIPNGKDSSALSFIINITNNSSSMAIIYGIKSFSPRVILDLPKSLKCGRYYLEPEENISFNAYKMKTAVRDQDKVQVFYNGNSPFIINL